MVVTCFILMAPSVVLKHKLSEKSFVSLNTRVECIFRLLISIGDKLYIRLTKYINSIHTVLQHTCSLSHDPHRKRRKYLSTSLNQRREPHRHSTDVVFNVFSVKHKHCHLVLNEFNTNLNTLSHSELR
jgi:hypothetical protein